MQVQVQVQAQRARASRDRDEAMSVDNELEPIHTAAAVQPAPW
ncbi:hypothetical protein BH10ACT6_BH10ACT6_13570 [soil metagenome]